MAHCLQDAPRQDRRQPERGLVEHEDLRVGHERSSDGQHLLLAARKRAGQLHSSFRKPGKQLENGGLALPHELAVRSQEVAAQVEVLFDIQDVEDAAPLGDVAEAHADDHVRGDADKALAVARDRSAARTQKPGDRPQRRRLAGAIASEDGDDLARLRVDRYALERLDVAVENVEVADFEEGQAPYASFTAPRSSSSRPR